MNYEISIASSYLNHANRDKVIPLWEFDAGLAALLGRGIQPALTQIKLAWWREAVERLDLASTTSQPLLEALQRIIATHKLDRMEIAQIAEGWDYLLGPEPLPEDDLLDYARLRGGTLFDISAQLLGAPSDQAWRAAGTGWALVDLARHSTKPEEARAALTAAAPCLDQAPVRWPTRLRFLGMLATLAKRDLAMGTGRFERQGSPGRLGRMLLHRLTGR